MKKKYDAVATIGEYQDKQGQTKKRYMTIGVVMEADDGRLSLKMEALPVTPAWSGWISFFEPKQYDNARPQQGGAPQQRTAHQMADDAGDSIPF